MRRATGLFALLASVSLLVAPGARAQQVDPTPPPSPAAPLLVPPRLLSDPGAPYPTGAKGDATVVLALTIDEDGSVASATAATPNEPFSSHAVDAARAWRFAPATREGRPVPARIRVEVVFHDPADANASANADANTNANANASADANANANANPRANADTAPLEVRVQGQRAEPSRSVTLTRTEVRQIPGVFGDPFRAIEIMPGVTPIVSGLPFFFVRGAPPGDVGYFLDGIRVPYLFHIGAGPSVVQPALVDRVDLYPGGYPAAFGRFSGGIVTGETTAPSPVARGEGNIRLFDSGAFVETPFADGRGDAAVGGRYSYTAALLSLVQSQGTLNYWDYQGRVGYDLTPRDRVSVFAFGAHDFLGDKSTGVETTVFDVTFHRVDLRYDHRLDGGGNLRLAFTGGLDRTGVDSGRYVEDHLLGARLELEQPLSSVALLRAGADVQSDRYKTLISDGEDFSESALAPLFPSRTDVTFGTRADVVLEAGPRLEITPGVRVDAYQSESVTAVGVDPRLSTRTVLSKHLRLLAAMGIAHQVPSFIVPIPGFQPGGLQGGLQTAEQESSGIEADLDPATTMTATLYHNAFFNLSDALSAAQAPVNGCGGGAVAGGSLFGGGSQQCTNGQQIPAGGDAQTAQYLTTRSNGSAYGVEFFLKRKLTNKIGGFVSYTLSRSVRTANDQHFVAPFDRTHVANAALAYDLGANWRAGTRVIFYTGLPKAYDPTDPGSTRLAPFLRIDLRLEKRWPLGPRAWVSFVAEWMNVTLSKESVGSNCTLQGCTEQRVGPITIPSLGLEGGF